MRLEKHEVIMHKVTEQPFSDMVAYEPNEESELDEQYVLSEDMFVELGEPEVITVAVRPGDRLNVDGAARFRTRAVRAARRLYETVYGKAKN